MVEHLPLAADQDLLFAPLNYLNFSSFLSQPVTESVLADAGRHTYMNPVLRTGLIGLLITLLYYLGAWTIVGRDPAREIVKDQKAPPRGLSPAAIRFILKMESDLKGFSATLLSLAVSGNLKIGFADRFIKLSKSGTSTPGLFPEEKWILKALFKKHQVIALAKRFNVPIISAVNLHDDLLSNIYRKRVFRLNRKWLIPGIVLSILTWGGMVAYTAVPKEDQGGIFFLVSFMITTIIFASLTVSRWPGYRTMSGAHKRFTIALAIFTLLLAGATIIFLAMFIHATGIWLPLFSAALVLIYLLFRHLMKAPSLFGQQLRDEIEGFRNYLSTPLNKPDYIDTQLALKKYEQYLPYAIALDVEKEWADKHKTLLTKEVNQWQYHPQWISKNIPPERVQQLLYGRELSQAIVSGLNVTVLERTTYSPSDIRRRGRS